MAMLDAGSRSRTALHFDEFERTTAGALAARDRPLGRLGHAALWSNLGAGLYLLIVGAWLVPSLSIPQAVLVAIAGSALGALLVGAVVSLAAERNRPGVALFRGALGESGAHLYGALALFRHVAWLTLQLAIAGDVAAIVAERAGLDAPRALWAAAFGAIAFALVLAGPATTVRRWFVPSAALTLLFAIVFSYSAWSDFGVPSMLKREPAGGWPGMTGGVDLVAACAIMWLPVAPDLGRLGGARRAGLAAGAGLAGMTLWFVLLGALFIPFVGAQDLAGFLLATPFGALALLLILVLEMDGLFVSIYSTASTARAWAPKADAALPVAAGGTALAVAGAALVDPFAYGDTLLLLGAAFAPLVGVLLGTRAAQRWAGASARPAAGGALAWAAGFLLYNWAAPLHVPVWSDALSTLFGDWLRLSFPADVPGLSATVLGAVASFALAAAATLLAGSWRGANVFSTTRQAAESAGSP